MKHKEEILRCEISSPSSQANGAGIYFKIFNYTSMAAQKCPNMNSSIRS